MKKLLVLTALLMVGCTSKVAINDVVIDYGQVCYKIYVDGSETAKQYVSDWESLDCRRAAFMELTRGKQ